MILTSGVRRHWNRFFCADTETRTYLVRYRYIPWLASKIIFPARFLLALVLRVVLLALKPLVHVRFGRYVSVSIGAWGIPLELYLCQKDAGLHPKRSFDIFYHWNNTKFMLKKPVRFQDQICNQQLHVMFKRTLSVKQVASTLDGLNRMLPRGSETFIVPNTAQYDPWGLLERYPVHLMLTDEEEQRGLEELENLGVDPGAPLVCFYARDGVFISRNEPPMTSLYGQRDENQFRNAAIDTYLPAVHELNSRGYFALRVGKYVENAMEVEHPRIIDYAARHHSDFMDVYLAAKCEIFIGTNGGIMHLPSIFHRPMAMANVIPLVDVVNGCANTVTIPKKFYSANKHRLLTFKEILSEPLLAGYSSKKHNENPEFFDALGLELKDNTPEEILELGVEMDQLVRGSFQPTQEDRQLQKKFLAILETYRTALPPFDDLSRLKMGSHFLRTHPELLD